MSPDRPVEEAAHIAQARWKVDRAVNLFPVAELTELWCGGIGFATIEKKWTISITRARSRFPVVGKSLPDVSHGCIFSKEILRGKFVGSVELIATFVLVHRNLIVMGK
jgi:hypothetical protein